MVGGGGGSGCDGLTVCFICGCSWDMLIVECALRNEAGGGDAFKNSRKKSFYIETKAGEGVRRYVCIHIYGLYENKNMF